MGFIEGVGPAIGNVASGIKAGAESVKGVTGVAPAMDMFGGVRGSIADTGPVMGPVDIGPAALEGPVSSLGGFIDMGKSNLPALDLKGGTYQPDFDLGGEILFNAKPQTPEAVLAEPETIAKIEDFLVQARVKLELAQALGAVEQATAEFKSDEPRVIQGASYWFADVPEPVVKPAEVIMPQPKPANEPLKTPDIIEYQKPQLAVSPTLKPAAAEQPKAEYKDSAEQAQAISVQPALQEEGAKMEEITEEQTQTGSKEAWEEEEARERKIIVEDSEVAAQRRVDIKEASKKAAAEAQLLGLKKIPSFLIAKFMPKEYKGVRSQVVKETGPDGSYQETVEEIAASGEFESETAATEYSNKVAESKKPAKWAEEGTPLAFEHVARIFKYGIVKPMQAHIEVIKRVVKKKVEVPGQNSALMQAKEPVKPKSERTLKDLGIAEVFVKAA